MEPLSGENVTDRQRNKRAWGCLQIAIVWFAQGRSSTRETDAREVVVSTVRKGGPPPWYVRGDGVASIVIHKSAWPHRPVPSLDLSRIRLRYAEPAGCAGASRFAACHAVRLVRFV